MTREEAINIMKDLRSEMEDARDRIAVIALNVVIKSLEERPHGEWIPCSERLPEEHHIYLTTIKKANGITFTTHSYFFTKEVGWSNDGVIAWMPFPEPYKRGEAE